MASYFSPVEGSFGTPSMAAPADPAMSLEQLCSTGGRQLMALGAQQQLPTPLIYTAQDENFANQIYDMISQLESPENGCDFGNCIAGGGKLKAKKRIQKGGGRAVDYLAHLLTIGLLLGSGYGAYTGWGFVEGVLVAKGILPKLCQGAGTWAVNLLFANKGNYCSDIAKRYALLSKAVATAFVAAGGFVALGTNAYSQVNGKVKEILAAIGRGVGIAGMKGMTLWNWVLGVGRKENPSEAAKIDITLQQEATKAEPDGEEKAAQQQAQVQLNMNELFDVLNTGHGYGGGRRRHKRKSKKRKSKKRKSKKRKAAKRKASRRRRRSRR